MAQRYIVVGLDFSEPSIAAARWTAHHLADGIDLVLAHAIYVPEPPTFLRGLYPPNDQLIEDARRGAELRLRELSPLLGASRIWPEVRVGRPQEVLVQLAQDFGAELLVVGQHGERRGVGKLLGSTAEYVAHHATTSVLLGRGLPAGLPRTVLGAIDESPLVPAIIDWVARLAEGNPARAVVTHVANPLAHGAVSIAAAPAERRKAEAQLRENAEAWVSEQLAGTAIDGASIDIAFGDPGFEILTAVQRFDADLLVLGRHGERRRSGPYMGSVVQFILRNGGGPVLVVGGGD